MASGYKVVFPGNLVPGANPDLVRRALRERFKLPDAAIDQFFDNKPIVLKVLDDEQAARQYKRALIDAGVDCRIVELTDKGIRLLRPKLTHPSLPTPTGRTPPPEPSTTETIEPLPVQSAPQARVLREERRIVEIHEPGAFSGRQLIGLLGCILVIIGVFSPIVSLPVIGSISYVHNGRGDGVFILVAALISFITVIGRQYRVLYWTGGFSLAVMLFTLASLTSRISDIKADLARDLAGNPFRGLADAAMSTVQIQWGWGLLIAGALLLLVSASNAGLKGRSS